VRADLTKDPRIRFWAVGPSLIAYRSVADAVEILFVERGDRDWRRLLRPRRGKSGVMSFGT
jgi:plasmid stabilization system protein ParE